MRSREIRERSNRTSESGSKSVKKRRFNNERSGERDLTNSPEGIGASKPNSLMLLKMERRVLKKNILDKKSYHAKEVGDRSPIESH